MKKIKISPVTLIVVVVCTPLIIIFAKDIFKSPELDVILPTTIPEVVVNKPTVIPQPISKPLSQDKDFPHELLPNFDITIPNSWYISGIKQFGEEDKVGFASNYFDFGLKNHNSMAVRVFKNGIFFNLIFDLVYDDQMVCSDNFVATDIGDKWYRIVGENKTFYSRNVYFNSTQQGSDKKYKVCTMHGLGLSQKPLQLVSPYGDGAIMLENIYVYGNPNQETLSEIDQIVRSIVF